MFQKVIASTLIGTVLLVSSARAEQAPPVVITTKTSQQVIVPKDPFVSAAFSVTTPGLGQVYVGRWKRGVCFFVGTVASFGIAAGVAASELDLKLSDYDKAENGGNGDGIIQTSEAKDWENKEAVDKAFDRLSGGEKAALISGAVAGVGLWVWNVIDAYRTAKAYNTEHFAAKDEKGWHGGMGMNNAGGPTAKVVYNF